MIVMKPKTKLAAMLVAAILSAASIATVKMREAQTNPPAPA